MIIFGYFIYFPIFGLAMFLHMIFDNILNYMSSDIGDIFSFSIFFFITTIYLISLLATIALPILKLINIKLQSDKINKIFFIGFCIFILMFTIGSITMLIFFK